MPELSRFFGITIKMYYILSDHNPPHIHASYGDRVAEFDIRTGEVLEGNIPIKACALVKKWIGLHGEELMDIWNTQCFRKIKPLE